MNELLVGYARVSTEQQDLTTQRDGLHALGVGGDRIYVDHGLTARTGTGQVFGWRSPPVERATPSCDELDRLTRSLPDARDCAEVVQLQEVLGLVWLQLRQLCLAAGPWLWRPASLLGCAARSDRPRTPQPSRAR